MRPVPQKQQELNQVPETGPKKNPAENINPPALGFPCPKNIQATGPRVRCRFLAQIRRRAAPLMKPKCPVFSPFF